MRTLARFTRVAPLLALAAVAAACTYVRATPLGAASYPTVPADSVRLFATRVPAHYVEIAMMRVEGLISNDARSARALREKAGKMGANGIILLNARGVSTHSTGPNVGVILGGKNPSTVVFGGEDEDVKEFERAVAIRYAPDTALVSVGTTP